MVPTIEGIGGISAVDPGTGAGPRLPDAGMADRGPEVRAPQNRPIPSAPTEDIGLVFEVGQGSGDLIIKIVDRESHRVIRQIPPEEVQRIRAAMREFVGLLMDRRG